MHGLSIGLYKSLPEGQGSSVSQRIMLAARQHLLRWSPIQMPAKLSFVPSLERLHQLDCWKRPSPDETRRKIWKVRYRRCSQQQTSPFHQTEILARSATRFQFQCQLQMASQRSGKPTRAPPLLPSPPPPPPPPPTSPPRTKVSRVTVPTFVWPKTGRSRPRRVGCQPLPFSSPLSFRRSMCGALGTVSWRPTTVK